MIAGEIFEIVLSRWEDNRRFKMKVECIYASAQVLRFKITGGKKEMKMEKFLFKKTSQWKIREMNFMFEADDKSVAMAIMNIQNEIDYRVNPPRPPNWEK